MSENTEITFLTSQTKGGDVTAQLTLAGIYDIGLGIAQNMDLATQWYREAAKQGSIDAQARVGEMYLEGIGIK